MDPRISAGFSILGNALMPDPSRLAQAEVYRSQMLENQANTGKLTAETEAIRRTAEQLALLQDLLANRDSTAADIISRGVGAGIATDPSQIPRFALGAESMQDFNINDPVSFANALVGTGQVAGMAQTPLGFSQDQTRQAAQAAATDVTAQRGQDLVHAASVYGTDVDARTQLERQRLDDLNDVAMNTADNDLLRTVEQAKLAAEYYDINKDSNDAAIRLGAEERWNQSERALTAAIARNEEATKLEQTRLDNIADAEQNADTIAGSLDQERLRQAGAMERQRLIQESQEKQEQIKLGPTGSGGAGWENVSFADRNTAYSEVILSLAQGIDADVDAADETAIQDAFTDNYRTQPPERMVMKALKTAFSIVGDKNPIEAAELVSSAIVWNEKKKRYVVNTNVFDDAEEDRGMTGDEEEPVPADTGRKPDAKGDKLPAATPAEATAEPVGTGKAEQIMIDPRGGPGKEREVYLENGSWFYTDDNSYMPGQ